MSILFGQDHFVSSIDIEKKNQFARQILFDGDYYILTTQSHCIDYEGSCGGILRVNINGEIIDTFLSEDFSSNLNALYLDSGEYYYSGEYKMGSALALSILKLNQKLEIIDSFDIKHENDKYYNFFANSSYKANGNQIVVGSSFCDPDCPQVSHLFSFEDDQLDTSLIFSFVNPGYTVPGSSMKNSKEELVIYFRYRNFDTNEDSIKIIKLDSNYNQVFEWSHDVVRNSIPRGCVTSDDNMIIIVPDITYGGIQDLWAIDSDGKIVWQYNWPDIKGTTNILRIKEANNSDIFIMGQRWNPIELDDLRNVAFVMRINSTGKEQWRRYFKLEDQNSILSNYVSDLVELDNGDLLLTGQTRRTFYDPVTGEQRPDQDIFWARIGGDGCINGDCEDIYLVSNIEDTYFIEEDVLIYPNPIIDNQLNIEVKEGAAKTALIYGLDGQLIKEVELTYGVNTISLVTTSAILLVRVLDKTGRLIYSEKVLRF